MIPRHLIFHLRYIIVFLVLPNMLFYVGSVKFFISRPLVNVDYLGLGICATIIESKWGRGLVLICYCGLLLLDTFVNFAPIYHFGIYDTLMSLGDLKSLDATHVGYYALGFLMESLSVGGMVYLLLPSSSSTIAVDSPVTSGANYRTQILTTLTVLICVGDIVNGTSFIPLNRDRALFSFNLANSATRKIILNFWDGWEQGGAFIYTALPSGSSATDTLYTRLTTGLEPRAETILLVNIESFGVFQDPQINEMLLQPLRDLERSGTYELSISRGLFSGATREGEFRELCHVRTLVRGERNLPVCVPQMLQEHGYKTIAIHGFDDQFYHRRVWYPLVGFQESYFMSDLHQQGLKSRCGSMFSGLCDDEIAEYISHLLIDGPNRKEFIYWMTLNSHLPLEEGADSGSTFDCQLFEKTRNSKDICIYARMIEKVLVAISGIARTFDSHDVSKSRSFRILITGDHAPPFARLDNRTLFSDSQVPIVKVIRLLPGPNPQKASSERVLGQGTPRHRLPTFPNNFNSSPSRSL